MKKIHPMFCLLLLVLIPGCSAPTQKTLKIFISVDMEGIAGVVSGLECNPSGPDYPYFRKIMTLETNAAIEGALAAGATEIVVRDGHGSKNNIVPDLLSKQAKLLRGVTEKPENMMLGLDDSFEAVLFIGYHAKAGTDQGIVAHTSSGNVVDFLVNNKNTLSGREAQRRWSVYFHQLRLPRDHGCFQQNEIEKTGLSLDRSFNP